jgi:tetratricopeptide (TPR) repeat protein
MTRWQRRQVERFIKQTVDEKSERSVIPVLVAGASASALPSLVQRVEPHDMRQRSASSIAAHIALATLSGTSNFGVNTAQSLSNVGNVLYELGELPAAQQALERALAIFEAQVGFDDPEVARTLNDLGNVLLGLDDLASARQAFERALAIREAQLGPDDPAVAASLDNLGNVLYSRGDLDTARAHFERALAIREAQLGPDDPAVASSLHNLALILRDLGDLDAARDTQQRALAIYEARLGSDHPLTMQTRREVAARPPCQHELRHFRLCVQ